MPSPGSRSVVTELRREPRSSRCAERRSGSRATDRCSSRSRRAIAGRDRANVLFELERRTRVQLDAVRMGIGRSDVRWTTNVDPRSGLARARVAAGAGDAGRLVRHAAHARARTASDASTVGGARPHPSAAAAPVVRVLGVEAAFARRSYLPEEPMALRVQADAPSFTLTFLRVGHGPDPNLRSDELTGLPMGDPVSVDWSGKRSLARTITVQSSDWPTGLYTAKLQTRRRAGGVRAVRAPPGDARRDARRCDPPDEHLAGLQPLRRGRRRLGRHLVRGRPALRCGSTGRTATGASRPASGATTSRSSAGSRRRAASPTSSRTTISRRSRAATSCAGCTTSSSSPVTAST